MKFNLGQLVATQEANRQMIERGISPLSIVARHSRGDWGELPKSDKDANELALQTGARIVSSYTIQGLRLWVITEATGDDGIRASTCILLPSEY